MATGPDSLPRSWFVVACVAVLVEGGRITVTVTVLYWSSVRHVHGISRIGQDADARPPL